MAQIAVPVLAKEIARKAIKEHFRRQGVKLSHVYAREINIQAKAWLTAHPEIILEAQAKAASLGYVADQGPPHKPFKGERCCEAPTRGEVVRSAACV
jgi:hypothetical protein